MLQVLLNTVWEELDEFGVAVAYQAEEVVIEHEGLVDLGECSVELFLVFSLLLCQSFIGKVLVEDELTQNPWRLLLSETFQLVHVISFIDDQWVDLAKLEVVQFQLAQALLDENAVNLLGALLSKVGEQLMELTSHQESSTVLLV